MRYTKELQENVCNDIKYGLKPQECADKYKIPVSVIMKWNNLNMTEKKASEIALRKYQVEVSNAEEAITNKLTTYLDPDISDEDFFKICEIINKPLYIMAAEIVKKERELNPKEDTPLDSEIISEITDKWVNNTNLKKYARL